MMDLPLSPSRGYFLHKSFFLGGGIVLYMTLCKECLVASRLKDFFIYCCIKNEVHLYADCFVFQMGGEWFGLGILVL